MLAAPSTGGAARRTSKYYNERFTGDTMADCRAPGFACTFTWNVCGPTDLMKGTVAAAAALTTVLTILAFFATLPDIVIIPKKYRYIKLA